jgi:hypothetical protein
MFENFLEDTEIYAEAESFWTNYIHEILAENASDWQPNFYTTFYRNGTKMRDGNPIFSTVNRKEHKIIRVIQHDYKKARMGQNIEANLIGIWVQDSLDAYKELVINCIVPTTNVLGQIRSEILNFITQDNGVENA